MAEQAINQYTIGSNISLFIVCLYHETLNYASTQRGNKYLKGGGPKFLNKEGQMLNLYNKYFLQKANHTDVKKTENFKLDNQ